MELFASIFRLPTDESQNYSRRLPLERLQAFVSRVVQVCEMLPDEVRRNALSLHEEAKKWGITLDELAVAPDLRKTQSKTSIYKLPDLFSVPPAVAAAAEKISRWILGYFRFVCMIHRILLIRC